MQAAGFVLVGGHSSRMGADKALLSARSGPLAQAIAARVAAAAGTAVLVGEPERYRHLGLECLPDMRPGMGPLSGIETALESARGELNLIVACDMPSLETEWLRKLLLKACETDALCVVSSDGNGVVHPLCAVYRSGCLRAVQEALNAGRLRVMDLLGALGTIMLQINTAVWNINTPQEWAAWGQAHGE